MALKATKLSNGGSIPPMENKEEPKENLSLNDLLQNQVCHEFDNERLYLSMALWCEENGYIETAAFFSGHSLEERQHGMDFINFMLKMKIRVEPPCPREVQRDFDDMKHLLEESVKREKETSKMISEIHKEAMKTNNLAITIANKYLQEQVEEEQLFESLLNLNNLCNGSKIDFEMEVSKIKAKDKYKIGTL